jgi:hypothetical protein
MIHQGLALGRVRQSLAARTGVQTTARTENYETPLARTPCPPRSGLLAGTTVPWWQNRRPRFQFS